jgi:hypothetical protein
MNITESKLRHSTKNMPGENLISHSQSLNILKKYGYPTNEGGWMFDLSKYEKTFYTAKFLFFNKEEWNNFISEITDYYYKHYGIKFTSINIMTICEMIKSDIIEYTNKNNIKLIGFFTNVFKFIEDFDYALERKIFDGLAEHLSNKACGDWGKKRIIDY